MLTSSVILPPQPCICLEHSSFLLGQDLSDLSPFLIVLTISIHAETLHADLLQNLTHDIAHAVVEH